MHTSRLVLPALACALLSHVASAQIVLHTIDGDQITDNLGEAVAGAGDVNGDGFSDIVVGSVSGQSPLAGTGVALVYSGADGSLLHTLSGNVSGIRFGWSVAGAGDVDGDGHDDVIVGAPRADNVDVNAGYARIYSGLDGSVIRTHFGVAPESSFGQDVDGAGDVNQDGFDDVVVASHSPVSAGQAQHGTVRVVSGADGSILLNHLGDAITGCIGMCAASAGDVNADGIPDVVTGCLLDSSAAFRSGVVHVYSGADGAVLHRFEGTVNLEQLGLDVDGAGDVNGDGYDDIVMSSVDRRGLTNGPGRVRLVSGRDGSILREHLGSTPIAMLGTHVAGVGDVDGDGFADYGAGAPWANPATGPSVGQLLVWSGIDGSVLLNLTGAPIGLLSAVDGAGDIDGDGRADVVYGEPLRTTPNGPFGRVQVRKFEVSCSELGSVVCSSATNSSGAVGRLQVCGTGDPDGVLKLTGFALPTNQFGFYMMSMSTQALPVFSGTLCLDAPIVRLDNGPNAVLNSGLMGVMRRDLHLTTLPQGVVVQAGETWNFQLWHRDFESPGIGSTANFSEAVMVTF